MPSAITGLIGVVATILGGGAVADLIAGALVYGLIGIGASFAGTYLQSLFVKKPTAKPSEMKTVIKQSAAARRRSYGLTMVGGVMVMLEENYQLLGMVIATGQGRINRVLKHYLDDREVIINEGGAVISYPYRSLSAITHTLGEDNPSSHPYMKANFPWAWSDAHLGRGVNSVAVMAQRYKEKHFMDMFPNGARIEYRQLREGALVYDPRNGQTAYSNNAALCIRDYLISEYGMRLPEEVVSVADDDWIKAANICDEAVPLKAGGTEPRYRIGMTYQLDESPADVLRRMLNACDAEVFPTPEGGLTIKVGKWETPTLTLDEDAITGISSLSRGADLLSRYNTIRAQYTSPDHNFEEVDADPWVDEASVSENGEISQDTQLYEVPSHSQTRRLMKRAYHGLNAGWRMTITTNLRGLAVFGERFIRVKINEFGINDTFEVQGQPQMIVGENSMIIGLQIELIAMRSTAFSWNPAKEEGVAPGANADTPPAFVLPVPTGFSVSRDARPIGGVTLYFAVFKADVPAAGNYIRYEISSDGGKNWEHVYGHEDTAKGEYGPLVDNIQYQFRARTVTASETAESEATSIVTLESGNTPELVNNGNFAFEGGWNAGTGWSLMSGSAVKTAGSAANLTQSTTSIIAGRKYRVSFTLVSQKAGSVSVGLIGGITVHGASRTAPGDYVEELSAPANVSSFGFIADATTDLSVTNFSVKEIV